MSAFAHVRWYGGRGWTRLSVALCILAIMACSTVPGRPALLENAASTGHAPGDSAPFADRTVDNLRAFARLYGYVRYFHPADEASAIDWERFAVYGVRRVKDAATTDELRHALEALFGPIAPTAQIYPAGGPAPTASPVLTPADTAGLERVAWQHQGVGLGTIHLYRSIRLNRETEGPLVPAVATFSQQVDATPHRSMEVRLEATARVAGPASRTRLLLHVRSEDGSTAFVDDVVITMGEWQRYTLEGTLANDATTISVSGALTGPATLSFDDFRLLVRAGDGDPWVSVPMDNPSFEKGSPGAAPPGWSAEGFGNPVRVVDGDAYAGTRFVALRAPTTRMSAPLFEASPGVGEVVEKPLDRGLVARIPLALYSRDGQTLRPPDASPLATLEAELEGVALDRLTSADEALRYANVIIAWNVMQHFYPYFDVVDVNWDTVLTETLERAGRDDGAEEFLRTLRWMFAHLADGHARVEHPVTRSLSGLPFLVDLVEGRVVIVALAAGIDSNACFRRGDVLASIDDVPSGQALREAERYLSGSPQWKRVHALRAIGQGRRGSRARLVLDRPEGSTSCEVVRNFDGVAREPRPASIAELREGIFYVDPTRAPMNAIMARIEDLAAADGVVFDMRGYPAGNYRALLQHLTDDTLYSAEWKTPLHIYPDQVDRVGFSTNRWEMPPLQPRFSGRVVFLTDARAMSYAESLMGIVEHYRLGEIVGQPTGGVNGNQNPFFLPGGFELYWTGMRVEKHDGSQLHNVGALPTFPVERSLEGVRAGRDEMLERALELLGEP